MRAQAARPPRPSAVRDPRWRSRATLLRALYPGAPVTRRELGRRTGLAPPPSPTASANSSPRAPRGVPAPDPGGAHGVSCGSPRPPVRHRRRRRRDPGAGAAVRPRHERTRRGRLPVDRRAPRPHLVVGHLLAGAEVIASGGVPAPACWAWASGCPAPWSGGPARPCRWRRCSGRAPDCGRTSTAGPGPRAGRRCGSAPDAAPSTR
ncbi:hypothetical protein NKH77_45145 [Streptomyces sp. M19]